MNAKRIEIPTFVLLAAAVVTTSLYVAGILTTLETPGLLADAVTADLALLIPLLYYSLLVRGRGWPTITVVPVFVISLLIASRIVPAEHSRLLDLLYGLIAPIELLVVGVITYKAWQLTRGVRAERGRHGDVLDLLRAAARQTLGNRVAADVLAFEIAILYFTFGARKKTATSDPSRSFSYHLKANYSAILVTIMGVGAVELFAVHLLVQRWSTTAAWVLTALSAYGLIWLVGDYRAILRRPIVLTDDGLDLRLGIRWSLHVPWELVRELRPVGYTFTAPKRKDYLNAVVFGAPNYVVDLEQPITAAGPYGIPKQVTQVGFTIDDPKRFDKTVQRFLVGS